VSTDAIISNNLTIRQKPPQYIQLIFPSPVIPKRISLTFQGGFAGKKCSVDILRRKDQTVPEWEKLTSIYPDDVNRRQVFDLAAQNLDSGLLDLEVEGLKLTIEQGSDFFSRVIVYDLQIEGVIP
jgi:hypothetical protein